MFWVPAIIVSIFAALGGTLWYLRRRLEVTPRYNFMARAEAIRGGPKPLPIQRGTGEVAWDVAQAQCKFEAEFATFVLLWSNHLGPVADKADAYRRGLAATLVWHGEDPQSPPTIELFDILHKEDAAAP